MIVTRRWLEEFIDLNGISTQKIIDTLNLIGQEVEGYKKVEVPQNVVVGKVIECKKHPNADKLNLTKIDVGDEILQIVTGANNIEVDKFVAVAKIGAVLGDNFKIKKAKLRGVESFGMICSSTEIGLPKLNDGILVLDDSLGELKVGEYVGKYLNDEIIELGVTANRGDCFSIRGIARELSAGLDIPLKSIDFSFEELKEGIGRIVNIKKNDTINSSCLMRAIEGEIVSNLKVDLRLAFCDIEVKDDIDKFLKYAMQATGVLIVASDISDISLYNKDVDIFETKSGKYLIGIKNNLQINNSSKLLINANYIEPKYVNELVFINGLKTDEYFFRASRGSESDLRFGMNYFLNEVNAKVFGGDIDLIKDDKANFINLNIEEINNVIGRDINEKEIVNILKRLKFEITVINETNLRVRIPSFRHDIENIQDLAEEILRVYGIDKLKSKPLCFDEKDRTNENIKEIEFFNDLRKKAVANGFYEVIHFVFDDKEKLQKYGFEVVDDNLDLINPIVKELDTLRTTLLLQLIEDVKFNKANGYKNIYLFTLGSVYNKKREESKKIAFIVNGFKEYESVENHGKPKKVDFKFLVDKLVNIIGEFKLKPTCSLKIAHPYQSATIIKDSKEVGVIAKLHPKVAKEFDIDDTFFVEIDLEAIKPSVKLAQDINKFPKVVRDLSIVVDKEKNYKEVYDIINNLQIKELIEFYPIDIYDLQKANSLTIRFVIQSNKTLTEEEINSIMDKIIKTLDEKGMKLR